MILYHLYVLSSKGEKVYLTKYPDTHKHCVTIASKQSDITRPKVRFEEACNNNKTRQLLPYGFVSFTGKKWPDCHVDSYNAIQKTINSFVEQKMQIPEYLLYGSHNLFSSYSN